MIPDLVILSFKKRGATNESEKSSHIRGRETLVVGNEGFVEDIEVSDCGAAARALKDVAGLGAIE